MIDRSFDRSIRAGRVRISGNTNDLDHSVASAALRIGRVSDKISKGCGALRTAALFASVALIASAAPALANGFGESRPWQFETTTDMVNRGYIVDLIERKRGGYYNSFQKNFTTNNYTTIGTQVNCSVSSTALGNSGSNAMDASASSPNINNSASIDASTIGNSANNSTQDALGASGIVLASNSSNNTNPPGGQVDNNQTNDGSTLDASVNGSSTTTSSGAVNAGDGQTSQVLNSSQDNLGSQASSVNDSTACSLAAGFVSSGPIN